MAHDALLPLSHFQVWCRGVFIDLEEVARGDRELARATGQQKNDCNDEPSLRCWQDIAGRLRQLRMLALAGTITSSHILTIWFVATLAVRLVDVEKSMFSSPRVQRLPAKCPHSIAAVPNCRVSVH